MSNIDLLILLLFLDWNALNMIKVNEIYCSIQGESSNAGLPCVFVRLTYCNLRCTWCDTEYAFYDGKDYTINQIIDEVKKYDCKLVEVTGGEPLFQQECYDLLKDLCDEDFDVMLETGGSIPINDVDERVMIVMDLKCPGSGMVKKNLYENIDFLKPNDEVKFVIGSREDYDWSKKIIEQYNLNSKCKILFSVVFGQIEPLAVVEWILKDKLDVRFQLQMHKLIWEPTTKGV
jgi:7-carboxy-7-deazaguanine synthase